MINALLFALLTGLPYSWFLYHLPESEVEVVLTNIKTPKGVFVISFYDNDASFPKPGKEAFTERVMVKDTMAHAVKCKLPAEGWYAIAMFQDEDETGKIKQDKIGIPLEAYAFSNNIHPKTGPPAFSACKFYVGGNNASPIAIKLIQPKIFHKN